jgi:hypothetical protein
VDSSVKVFQLKYLSMRAISTFIESLKLFGEKYTYRTVVAQSV